MWQRSKAYSNCGKDRIRCVRCNAGVICLIALTASPFTNATSSQIVTDSDSTTLLAAPRPGNLRSMNTSRHAASSTSPYDRTNIQYVDGVHNATVQDAVTAACAASSHVVIVPPGRYVGPTSLCASLKIDGINYGLFSAPTTFTYTSAFSISNLSNLDIEGIRFDFGEHSNANLTLSSVSAGRFDLEVANVPNTVPAVVLTCTANNNTAYNWFDRIITLGGSEGIRLMGAGGASPTCAVTENHFGFIQEFAPATVTSGNWIGTDFYEDADSNTIERISLFSQRGLTTIDGIDFNTASLTEDYDTGTNDVWFFDSTGPDLAGCAIRINQSTGNSIKAGVLNWRGSNQVCVGKGANPSIDFALTSGGNYTYFTGPIIWGSPQPQLRFSSGIDTGIFSYFQPPFGFADGTTWTLPPGGSSSLVGDIARQTLSHKTLSSPILTGTPTGDNVPILASLTTSATTSDNVPVIGMTSSGHCTLSATNAGAATHITSSYISAKKTNQITVTHAKRSGMTYDIVCTPN